MILVVGSSVAIGFFVLSPISDTLSKSNNPCLHIFNEYSSLFDDVSPDDTAKQSEIMQNGKIQTLIKEFQELNCDTTVNEWADEDLETRILLNQAGLFDI